MAHAPRALLRLVRVEALLQLGDREPALAALREARDRVLRLAGSIGDLAVRDQYLTRVDANVRTLALAREVLGEA